MTLWRKLRGPQADRSLCYVLPQAGVGAGLAATSTVAAEEAGPWEEVVDHEGAAIRIPECTWGTWRGTSLGR